MNISIAAVAIVLIPFSLNLIFYQPRSHLSNDFINFRVFFRKLSSFGLVSLSGIILGKSIYYFLASYRNQELLAIFSVSEIISSVLVTFFSVITIKYSKVIYNSRGNHSVLIAKFFYLLTLISIPAILVFFFFGGYLFSMVYGEAYRIAGNFAYLQVIISFLSATSSFLVALNISKGVIHENSFSVIITVILLMMFKFYFDTLSLFNLYIIVIAINIATISYLLLINFLKNGKRISEA
jgi:O-antigen/teichoic acid export membrane protein